MRRLPPSCRALKTGATLPVTLMMLVLVLLTGLSMSTIALMDEKAARNERDRIVALQAAEAALADAELDIENSPSPASRSALFSPHSGIGFSIDCARGDTNIYQGLCLNSTDPRKSAWRTVDIANSSASSVSVRLGRFTGQTMPIGVGPLPAQIPRYVIELMPDSIAGQSADPVYMYRITAIGFGSDPSSQAVVQSFYRKISR